MAEINLLRSLPKVKRDLDARRSERTKETVKVAKRFGKMFFDGPRKFGYGGYKYDGRWQSVAKDIVEHFKLKPGDKILDVGCAKGFLVKDFLALGIDAYGLDISKYAVVNCEPEVVGRLHIGSAEKLPFPDDSFSSVISINTLHNLHRKKLIRAIREMERASKGKNFIQVDSYRSPEGKKDLESWVLTAVYHDYPENWIKLFNEAQYKGDWYWTIL